MKKAGLTILVLTISHALFAQKGYPDYGTIDKSDLQMTQCDLDKDAYAYKLLDYGDVRYVNGKNLFKIQTERRVRIKILKERGRENANIKIKYYSLDNFEDISNISAVTYNLDNAGNIITTKLDKASIYRKPVSKKFSEVAFSMPDVKPGSVIEYRYKDSKESFSDLDDWFFQDVIPTRVSIYRILVPSIFRFFNQLYAYQKVDVANKDIQESMALSSGIINYNSIERTYTLKNAAALKDEPFMGAAKDYLQRVVFQLSEIVYPDGQQDEIMSTWKKITDELLDDEDFGDQIKKNIPHTGVLDDSLKLLQGDYKKMLAIYRYVQQNMNWNGEEGIYTSGGIKSAWDKKSGSNAEINLLLLNLLKTEDIKAYPLLVSTKDNGTVNTVYPLVDQFNNVMVVAEANGKRFILNAADKYNPATLIPYDVLNNEGFVVDKQNGGWIILSDEAAKYKNTVVLSGEISDDGLMHGNATVYSYSYSKNPRVQKWKEDKPGFNDYFSKSFTGLKVEDLTVGNEDIDTLPLKQHLNFTLAVNNSGEYDYFPVNLFQGLEKIPLSLKNGIPILILGTSNRSYW